MNLPSQTKRNQLLEKIELCKEEDYVKTLRKSLPMSVLEACLEAQGDFYPKVLSLRSNNEINRLRNLWCARYNIVARATVTCFKLYLYNRVSYPPEIFFKKNVLLTETHFHEDTLLPYRLLEYALARPYEVLKIRATYQQFIPELLRKRLKRAYPENTRLIVRSQRDTDDGFLYVYFGDVEEERLKAHRQLKPKNRPKRRKVKQQIKYARVLSDLVKVL